MKKISKKKIILIVIAVILLIVIAFVIFKLINKNELNLNVDANGNVVNGDIMNSDGSNAQLQQEDSNNNSEATYNPNSIPQKDTEHIEQYIDDKGNEVSGEDLSKIKDNIIQAFKKIPMDKLGLDVNLDEVRIIFNQGTTVIDQNNFFVFCIYTTHDNRLKNIGMFAMTKDTKTLYKFNSENLTYDLIEK